MTRCYGRYSSTDVFRQIRSIRHARRHRLQSCLPKNGRMSFSKSSTPPPLICPHGQHRMRVLAVIDQREVIEKILLHLNL